MEKRVNKHVFAWVFCFLLGELGVDAYANSEEVVFVDGKYTA